MSLDPYADFCRAEARANPHANVSHDQSELDDPEAQSIALLLAAGARAKAESPVCDPYTARGDATRGERYKESGTSRSARLSNSTGGPCKPTHKAGLSSPLTPPVLMVLPRPRPRARVGS